MKTECKSCDWQLDDWEEKHPTFHKDTDIDVKRANDYCEKHTFIYGDECEPIWCKECGHLKIYEITVTEKSRNITPNFDKKRK
jgi:hypothetical protein